MTQFPDLFESLAAPFDPREVRERQQAGRAVQYITARTAMNRLDTVLGPENWWDEYTAGENSVLCKLTVRLPDGSILTKSDAGGYAGMSDQGDDDKSGYSDAFKRAAVKFGVGRYLYRDGVPSFRTQDSRPKTEEPGPRNEAPAARPTGKWGQPRPGQSTSHNPAPKTGRQLFAWLQKKQQQHDVRIIDAMSAWGGERGYPGRIVAWPDDAVAEALTEAVEQLRELIAERGDSYEGAA